MHSFTLLLLTSFTLLSVASPTPPHLNLTSTISAGNPLNLSSLLSTRSSSPSYSNSLTLIRHGEKPSDGGVGLSSAGEKRAQCLRSVFGVNSRYNIGKIIAEGYNADGTRERPYETVLPLAQDLGLTVDVSCSKYDDACVAQLVQDFANTSGLDVLICWEHSELTPIASALGVSHPPKYPSDSFDIEWHVQNQVLTGTSTEDCAQYESQ